MSKKGGAGAAGGGGAAKVRGKAGKDVSESRVKEECVASIINILLSNINEHIKDKFIFPRTVAFAVASTMAEMLHMVSIAHIQRMESWLVDIEGSAPEEWDKPQEPLVPLIDSWARGVVPLKCNDIERQSVDASQEGRTSIQGAKQPRRGSSMALSQYQNYAPRRSSALGSKQSLRGSLRRFSDDLYPLDPSRKVKFQEKSVDVSQKDIPSRRNSITPSTNFLQDSAEAKGSVPTIEKTELNGRSSIVQEDKTMKSKMMKSTNSFKK
ncbi:hypothetical protein KP509_31G054600 [Ceratopteris richardii]|uniref:Uncharacterized protein n=1 Tax=Ceratopteris richardii TaxID=49495 RepID=A0A8T2QYV6_CERRI|nr:hypothetical protein KP509_31G054600 [Ceratopteris richardii]